MAYLGFLLFCHYLGKALRGRLENYPRKKLENFLSAEEMDFLEGYTAPLVASRDGGVDLQRCTMETCFNLTRCADRPFKVYVYQQDENVSPSTSYVKIVNVIKESSYYTANPEEAGSCLLAGFRKIKKCM